MHIILECLYASGEGIHLGIHRSVEVCDDALDEVELSSLSVHLVLDSSVEQVEGGLDIRHTIGNCLGEEFLLSDDIVTEKLHGVLESGDAVIDSSGESLYFLAHCESVVIEGLLEEIHLCFHLGGLAVQSLDNTREITIVGVLHLVVDFRCLVHARCEKRRGDYA